VVETGLPKGKNTSPATWPSHLLNLGCCGERWVH